MRKKSNIKIIIEKHKDGYVAYPIGLKGVVVGQGITYNRALENVQSAIRFHRETFGLQAIRLEHAILDVFVAEIDASK